MNIIALLFRGKGKPVGELLQTIHTQEIYHVQNALPGETYPLTEAEILRLLHTAQYADCFTRASIQVRLHQAMLPDPDERDIDQERRDLDHKYLEWSQSGKRPTPVLAQDCSRLLQRERRDHRDATTQH